MKQISTREREVLHLVAYEHNTKEIADALYISEHTVMSHRKNLLYKFKVKNTAGLVRRAFEVGLMRVSQITIIVIILLLGFVDLNAQDDFISIWETDYPGVTETDEIRIPATGLNDIYGMNALVTQPKQLNYYPHR